MSDKRDGFLDVVRAIATVRVVLWHAFGAAALTFVAAMPAMFFVTGSLYSGSVDRHGARATLFDRLRRIGPSLWLFGAIAWAAMAVGAHLSGTELPLARMLLWFLPVGDPGGSPWEAGWLATPLWYLRTLLWIFLVAPVIIRAARRWPVSTLSTGAFAVVALELVDRAGAFRPSYATHLVWQVGDVVLYGWFFTLGVLASDGAFRRVTSRQWGALAAVAAVMAALWWFTQPVPEGIVNNSHPMHLFVGVAWLAVAMAAQAWLRAVARHRVSRPAVRFLSQRSLTVYLWHTTAIVMALWFVNRAADLPPGVWTVTYLALIVAGVALLAAAFGWLEDLAAKRKARVWPVVSERPATPGQLWARVAFPVAIIAVVALALPTGTTESVETAFTPRVPSQAPPRPQIVEVDPLAVADTEPVHPFVVSIDPDTLQYMVDDWTTEFAIAGASMSVTAGDGGEFATAVGFHEDGTVRQLSDRLDVQSVTKLFTANLVYRAVDSGRLDLDAPLPSIDAEPEFPYADRITVRQLLSHRSGIVNYRDSTRYASDPSSISSVSDAIASSVADPLAADPGVAPVYSSTNYLLLGRLLEQVTGVEYDALLTHELLVPLGMASAAHLGPDPGEPRFATAGLVADVSDLGRAGVALLRDHVGISDQSYGAMREIDLDSGMGPGLNGFCPCRREFDGSVRWFGVGYTGGNTLLAYVPEADVVVTIDVTGGLYGTGDHFEAVMELARRVSALVRLPTESAGPV